MACSLVLAISPKLCRLLRFKDNTQSYLDTSTSIQSCSLVSATSVGLLHLQGVHYGMFPGAGNPPTTVWTAIRPHNWRPTTNKEWLVEFDMVTGEAIDKTIICYIVTFVVLCVF
jgi:hypothetical protein